MKQAMVRLLAALAIAAVLGGAASRPVAAAGAPATTVTVFAAASLTQVFTEMGKILEDRISGLRVTFVFAGTQQIAHQIEQGDAADVFASADQRWMTDLVQRGLILGAPREFARNSLVVAIARANPNKIEQLQDLARPGLKLAIAADAVPVGHYAREVLAKLDRAPGFGPDFAKRVLQNVATEDDNVKAVVARVERGEADAGIVYRSEVGSIGSDKLAVMEIPGQYNVVASYQIAMVKGAHVDVAQQFGALVLAPLGQQLLRAHLFVPVVQF